MDCLHALWIPIGVVVWLLWRRRRRVHAPGLAVVVSGCDTGIGHRLAVHLDGLGCEVFAGCLDAESARRSLPGTVTVLPLDLTDEGSVEGAVGTVRGALEEKGKNLWALVNNAGVCVYGEFEWQTWNQCRKQVDVNLLGTMRLTKAFLPLLRRERGRVITITSVNGRIAYPGLSVYSATKFALEGLFDALRLELRRSHGIRVVVVRPGDLARLTSIMSRHEQNADEMWTALSEEDRVLRGDFFKLYHRVTLKNYGLTSPRTFEDSPLLRDLEDAVLSVRPADRYVSAPLLQRILYSILALAPTCLRDRILDAVTDALFRSDASSS